MTPPLKQVVEEAKSNSSSELCSKCRHPFENPADTKRYSIGAQQVCYDCFYGALREKMKSSAAQRPKD